MGPLTALAARHGLAVVHFAKDGRRSPLARVSGSMAFGAAARSVLAVVADPQDPRRRLMVPDQVHGHSRGVLSLPLG